MPRRSWHVRPRSIALFDVDCGWQNSHVLLAMQPAYYFIFERHHMIDVEWRSEYFCSKRRQRIDFPHEESIGPSGRRLQTVCISPHSILFLICLPSRGRSKSFFLGQQLVPMFRPITSTYLHPSIFFFWWIFLQFFQSLGPLRRVPKSISGANYFSIFLPVIPHFYENSFPVPLMVFFVCGVFSSIFIHHKTTIAPMIFR